MPSAPTPQPPTEWKGVSSIGRRYEIVSCALFSLAFVTVVLRITARLRQFRRLFADDYLSIVSMIFGFGLMAEAIIFAEAFGLGWHLAELPPAQIEKFFQLFYAAEITYCLLSPFYKLAVIFLYRRIFADVKAFNIASWIMVGVSIGWGIGGFFSTILQCTPVPRAWNQTIPGSCINIEAYILGLGIANLVIDALILFMPLPMIWKLQLNIQKKFALTGMFLLGALVCLAGILRIVYLLPIDLTDATYSLYSVAIWSEIEPAVGIIAACLPTLRQFFFSKTQGISGASSWNYRSGRSGRSGGKTPLDSTLRSNTAMALTGWKTSDYAEVKSSNSGYITPSRNDLESSNDTIERDRNFEETFTAQRFDFGSVDKNKSILVNQEISVRYD